MNVSANLFAVAGRLHGLPSSSLTKVRLAADRGSTLRRCRPQPFCTAAPPAETSGTAGPRHGRDPPSASTRRLAEELLALKPVELKELRQLCRERLIPKPTGKKKLPKNYDPSVKVKRSDRPFPLRAELRALGHRFPALHPVWIFAGTGPRVLPESMFMPALTQAIMGKHAAEMAASVPEGMPAPAAADAAAAAAPEAAPAEDAEANEDEVATKTEEPLKANVNIKLTGFAADKKIAVVKEVRALVGSGLKESKEMVEGAPTTLMKGVPRGDAEGMVEKLRAAGAEIDLV
eukprot:TRINITY_DN42964_c0_g1_i1.p1 TRINITY_DN42964_c0_g1~~TRINITY_DN42964_c0_g1_i1.p1  ORF type:complete len:290 (+),score=68.53 TRINITY_DN42964_c0_g1_i1:72-941(+)